MKDIMHPSRIHDWATGSVAHMLVHAYIAATEQLLIDQHELRKLHKQIGYKPPEKKDDDKAS